LAGITTCDISRDRTQQAWQTFEAIEDALAHANMDWSHVVRTWLFIDRILEWYGEFNAARTAFYKDRGVFERLLPASTGIGGSNPRGAAVLAAALAIKPRAADVTAEAVESPLQCPATRYASSFSRAVEVCMPDCRRLFVSGTASIDRDGRTIHVGDAYSQIAWTFDVVQALLESRGMHWADVTRATAYLRFAADALTLRRFLDARPDLSHLPLVVANNVICRRDLLFELEVDASR
jgi:enamine deaminase RidA (YjgF/YER057c/UK114 family)